MNNLTPEQRYSIGLWAGVDIEQEPFEDNSQVIYVDEEGWLRDYTPDTNDSQAFELLRKLLDDGYYVKLAHIGDNYLVDHQPPLNPVSEGPTLNLAICHAVLAAEVEG